MEYLKLAMHLAMAAFIIFSAYRVYKNKLVINTEASWSHKVFVVWFMICFAVSSLVEVTFSFG